jgi:hypothetical protein
VTSTRIADALDAVDPEARERLLGDDRDDEQDEDRDDGTGADAAGRGRGPDRSGSDGPDDRRLRWRTTGGGHSWVSDRPDRHATPVYLHRLTAVAWGILRDSDPDDPVAEDRLTDALADPRDVHHEVPDSWIGADEPTPSGSIPWLDTEATLSAETRTDHSRRHLTQARHD